MNLIDNITQHALLVIGVLLIIMAIMIVANYLIVKKLKTKHQKAIGLANSNHKSNLTAIEKLKGEIEMQLNIDDTFEEQYINSMHKESDVMINCEYCARLFYIDYKID